MDFKTLLFVVVMVVVGMLPILFHKLRSFVTRRRIDQYIEKLRVGETPNIPEREHFGNEITVQSTGFTVSRGSESPTTIEWVTVVEATAYKRELFTTDQVCIEFRLSSEAKVEVHEDMKGWTDLCEVLPTYLNNSRAWPDWYTEIIHPAFELNPTLLYRCD